MEPKPCDLCGRVTKRGTTEHHLIPRTCHRNKWFKKRFSREAMNETVSLCHACHGAIHEFFPREKELGRYFHSLELLASHPKMARHLAWVKKQK